MSGLIGALYQNQQFQQGATVDALAKIAAMQEKNRSDELTRKFLSMGDYSPANIQKFAQETGATQDDIGKLMGIAKDALQYKKDYDPLREVNQMDAMGNKTSQLLPESKVAGMGPIVTDRPTPQVRYDKTGQAINASPFSDFGNGIVPESEWSLLQQIAANKQESEADRQNRIQVQNINEGGANTRNAASIAAQKEVAKIEYDYKTEAAKQEATEKAAKEESAKIDSILKEGKAMLVPKGPPIFSLDGSVDEAAATAVYDEIKPLVNSPDRGKAAAAQQWMNAFNRKFGVTTNQVAVEDPLGLFK